MVVVMVGGVVDGYGEGEKSFFASNPTFCG